MSPYSRMAYARLLSFTTFSFSFLLLSNGCLNGNPVTSFAGRASHGHASLAELLLSSVVLVLLLQLLAAAPQSQSPAMQKRFKLGMHGRMCSIESDPMADLSSSSLSPCPSPVRHRDARIVAFLCMFHFTYFPIMLPNWRIKY